MTRQIIVDTETTGLDPKRGDRIIEIGCVELIDRKLTGQNLHFYLNPDRTVEEGALKVHGISNEFLQDKPRFLDKAEILMTFLMGAELIIHNAEFDLGFLNAELSLLRRNQYGRIEDHCQVVDTLALARQMHPGQRNSLDAVCKRYEVKNTHRQFHGALLDAEILAHVYLAMTGGQKVLFVEEALQNEQSEVIVMPVLPKRVYNLRHICASAQEQSLHEAYLQKICKTRMPAEAQN